MADKTEYIKAVSEDLSLLNGIPSKVNAEYIKNLQQIILFDACEQIIRNKKEIKLDIPMFGTISYRPDDDKFESFSFKFEPNEELLSQLKLMHKENTIELPDMFADKYGNKILKAYTDYLEA